jgi:regulator of protease activity HflC (stomatin/prohibitin superfamily)
MSGGMAFALAFLVFGVITVFMTFKPVPQGQNWLVARFGGYRRTLFPGPNFIVPFVDSISAKMTMMESFLDVPSQEVITKDNAMVRVDAVVFFQVFDAAKAAYEVNNLTGSILNLSMTNLRTVVGSMTLDEINNERERINASLLKVVDEATTPWGVKINRIEIREVTPPRDLIDSMARQMKAERDKRATILEADAARENSIRRAEGEKQAAILEAEGRREAAYREAEARERLAQAEAASTKMVSDAIASGSVQSLNYFVAQKYIEAMKAFANSPNQKLLMMPMEASSVIGSIAGIAELAKEALSNRSGTSSASGSGGRGGSVPSSGA